MILQQILRAITESIRRGDAAIVGAVARNAWAPPRATTDLDLAVSAAPGVLQSIEQTLLSLGYECVRRQQASPEDSLPDMMIFRSEDMALRQVDLLVAKTAFEVQVLQRAVEVEMDDISVPVATPEDLIVYKLIASRPRDIDDIRTVIRTQNRSKRKLDWDHIERWAGYWEISDRLAAFRTDDDR